MPVVAAGIEEKAWGLERVVDMTAAYMARKREGAEHSTFTLEERV